MCFRTKSTISSTGLVKIAIVLIVICYTQYSEGGNFRGQTVINKKKMSACLSYGHSCLGAHGKRAEQLRSTPVRDETLTMDVPIDIRWFLNKLYERNNGMDSIGLRYRQRDNNQDLNEFIKSMLEDDENKDSQSQDFYQDESKFKDNQLWKFLKNRKFEEPNHN